MDEALRRGEWLDSLEGYSVSELVYQKKIVLRILGLRLSYVRFTVLISICQLHMASPLPSGRESASVGVRVRLFLCGCAYT